MFKPILLLLCLVAVTVRQAMAMKICTMKPDYNSGDGKVKTYQGKIVKQFDEADTPAMQGNDCVELWCRHSAKMKENARNLRIWQSLVEKQPALCTRALKSRTSLAQETSVTQSMESAKVKWIESLPNDQIPFLFFYSAS
eukprot:jgi/Picre1/27509/NNA_000476.t1